MRTRTLFLSAAALVAGLASSVAQSNVYSVNVVGYVNKVLPANQQVAIANPLDNGTNDLNSVLGTLPAKSTASLWNGTGFTTSIKGASAWNPNESIPPGTGLFVNSKSAWTNTFVGSVVVNSGESITNALPAGTQVLVGSMIPYAGDLNNTNINLALPAKSTASFWTGTSYDTSIRGASAWNPNLPIEVGQGFFLNSKSAYNWVQTLPSN
jgi:hypothetical protein